MAFGGSVRMRKIFYKPAICRRYMARKAIKWAKAVSTIGAASGPHPKGMSFRLDVVLIG